MSATPHFVIVNKGGAYWEGGRQYTINLARALTRFRRDPGDYDVSVLVADDRERAHYQSLRPHLKHLLCLDSAQAPWTFLNKVRWKLGREFLGLRNPRLEELLLRMGATFVYPALVARTPCAEWIPDFQYRHFPEGSNSEEIAGRKAAFAEITCASKRVALSSSSAERDCVELFPISKGKTFVLKFRVFVDDAWLADDPRQSVARYRLPERFLLVSNVLAPTKNHALVLDALSTMGQEARARAHVVMTGNIFDYRNPGFYNGFLARLHELGLRENVSILGLVPKRDQVGLLRASLAYLQPSLFEGWNTGVEEARLFGKPLLISDIDVHREQMPPDSNFFDPRDARSLAGQIEAIFARPGPTFDVVRETRARSEYAALQQIFADSFIDLATGKAA